MTLLITTGTIVVADWKEGDGHKMHWPQLPDPNGWDVDWGNWYLGDDWKCSETGTVDDIHFWFSCRWDEDPDIREIYVSIWSNNEGPPSTPEQNLWDETFLKDEGHFIIKGPWYGDQGWYNPDEDIFYSHDHNKYYQINIPNIPSITSPHSQEKDVIYWLVIKIPDNEINNVGWKTSKSAQFLDTAVFDDPTNGWTPFYNSTGQKLDLAFVINGTIGDNDPPDDPDIWGDVEVVVGKPYDFEFASVDPDGDMIAYYIEWGDGIPPTWSDFLPSGAVYTKSHTWWVQGDYTIRAKAKDTYGAESGWGELRITVPREKSIMSSLFYHLLEQFPILQWFFQQLRL
jgi:hypothetical protein